MSVNAYVSYINFVAHIGNKRRKVMKEQSNSDNEKKTVTSRPQKIRN